VSRDSQQLYVADANNYCIKVVCLKDKIIEKVAIFCTNVGQGTLLVFSGSSMAQMVVNLLWGGVI
jgi:hypothetical protein